MSDILFLAHRIPYPPNKGDKIRSWHVLQYLMKHARVHVGCFLDDPADEAHVAAFQSLINGSLHIENVTSRARKIRQYLKGLQDGRPLTMAFYDSPNMASWIARMISDYPIKSIYAYSSGVAPFALNFSMGRRLVLDMVDMDSDKWKQYAQTAHWPLSKIYAREAKLLFDLERRLAHKSDTTLFVSEAEVATFKSVAGSSAHDVRALENGVDHAFFSPSADYGAVDLPGSLRLVFTGAMDYWANVDAACWFAKDIFPIIKAAIPETSFTIVGSKPTSQVMALAKIPGITVTGFVPDVRPYIAAADIAVAPLRIARGIQNKVLEAMAMSKPVVVTRAAAEGIAANSGEHFLVADTADTMAQAVLGLSKNVERRTELGAAARSLIINRYDWQKNLSILPEILGFDGYIQENQELHASDASFAHRRDKK